MSIFTILMSELDEETSSIMTGRKEHEPVLEKALVVLEENLLARLVFVVIWIWEICSVGVQRFFCRR